MTDFSRGRSSRHFAATATTATGTLSFREVRNGKLRV